MNRIEKVKRNLFGDYNEETPYKTRESVSHSLKRKETIKKFLKRVREFESINGFTPNKSSRLHFLKNHGVGNINRKDKVDSLLLRRGKENKYKSINLNLIED